VTCRPCAPCGAALPDPEIVFLSLRWARTFAERYRCYLDGSREFPSWPGLPEQPVDARLSAAFLTAMQEERFDLAIQMQGNGSVTNQLAALLGAQRCAGYYLPGQFNADRERFLPYPDDVLAFRRHLRLMEFLGVPSQREQLEFPLSPEDHQALAAVRGDMDLTPGRYVCIHPGASAVRRRWPAEHFAAVGDPLAARGLGIVLTRSKAEAELTHTVARVMRSRSLDLGGKTSLGALGTLLHGPAC
jgi:ADP-heptose:LPS heptosyltransferase